jgi:acyl-CoA synthetase (AMP-forming)/AMP-acid ligase II
MHKPPVKTLGQLLERNAWWYPDRDALVMDGERRSYADLYARASMLASALEKTGLPRQARIGVISQNSIQHHEIFAASDIGAFITAPVSFRAAPPEMEWLITDSGASVLFFQPEYADIVAGLRDRIPDVRLYVCIGDATSAPAPDWATDYEAFLATGDSDGPRWRSTPDDYSTLFYTSGTTGRPKGVPHTHRGLITGARASAIAEWISLLQISPPFHVGGRGFVVGTYWVGGKTTLHRSFDPTALLRDVEKERVNHTFMVPAMVLALLDHPDIDKYDLSSLSHVMLASTAIPTEVLRRALARFGPVFFVAYGSTESGGLCKLPPFETTLDGDEKALARLASVGHFESDIDGVILDDDGNEVPVGTVGEVCVRNSHYFTGYWNNHKATIDAMHGNALRTGDLGYQDEQGYVFLVDRKKDMLITGGENVYSREVEEALDRHPAVRESAVIGVPDPKWGESVCAVIILEQDAVLTEAELIAFAQTQLAKYKCPREVHFVDDMPRQATNKTDKRALRALYSAA